MKPRSSFAGAAIEVSDLARSVVVRVGLDSVWMADSDVHIANNRLK